LPAGWIPGSRPAATFEAMEISGLKILVDISDEMDEVE
jgi:hypothetical protein